MPKKLLTIHVDNDRIDLPLQRRFFCCPYKTKESPPALREVRTVFYRRKHRAGYAELDFNWEVPTNESQDYTGMH